MRVRAAGSFVMLSLMAALGSGQGPVPLGEEFQVNTYTTSGQGAPSVAASRGGSFVVVWDSYGSSGTDWWGFSVQGQLYDASGDPTGNQFQINSYTPSAQFYPSVARRPDGEFIVVWESYGSIGSDSSNRSIQGQRFDAAGSPIGGEFQVNSYTTGSQYDASVAVGPDGNFSVVWVSDSSSGMDLWEPTIKGQLFDASGKRIGGEFKVNSYRRLHQGGPSVGLDEVSNFVVVWNIGSGDPGDPSILGKKYDAAGNAIGGEFVVNSYTSAYPGLPSVAVWPDGQFDVVWHSTASEGSDNDAFSIQGRRFSADGIPADDQFQVNSYTTDTQKVPSVAVDVGGGFLVVWRSNGSSGTDSSDSSIQGQLYDAAGSPIGGEFQVNSHINGLQSRAAVAAGIGHLVVVWQSLDGNGTDTSGWRIQGKRYASPWLIFANGFQSGDTSAWSSMVQ